MSEQEFVVGERLRVIYDSARVEAADDLGLMHVSIGNWHTVVNLRNSGVTVERIAPPGWPPQVGDIWVDGSGDEWHAIDRRYGISDLVLILDNYLSREPDELCADFGPLRLVRRRDCDDLHDGMHPQPGDQPSAPVPNGVDGYQTPPRISVDPDMRTAGPDRQATP